MELTENTLQILKNFSAINSNIVIREGNTVQTIAEAKNLLAKAEVTERFPQDFGVYDLSEFLGVLGLVDQPQLELVMNMSQLLIQPVDQRLSISLLIQICLQQYQRKLNFQALTLSLL